LRVVDLCSGSGAIALAVKDEVPDAEVHGVELSDLAHAWAIRNRDDLGLDVDLRLGDASRAFPELEAAVDVVVSNPPYIPEGSIPNDPEVRDHDPEVALYGGSSDGLRIPLQVAARAAVLLRAGGFFVMEHADVQGDSLTAALRKTGLWQDVQDHLDLNGRPRAVTAVRAP
jgi:release factor glutamine methyltransferase